MAHQTRMEYPGAFHHVLNRGDRWEGIFLDEVETNWYHNTMRGIRTRHWPEGSPASLPRPTISPPPPRRLLSQKWRDLIQQVWHTDPLGCPGCHHFMRGIALIDQPAVGEKILRHLGLWTAVPPPNPWPDRPRRPRALDL